MIRTPNTTEKYKGSDLSTNPTGLGSGVFSLCRGGVPKNGAFARIAGKTIKAFANLGGVISIAEFGRKIVVQYFSGIVIYDARELQPTTTDYVVDNEGNLVYDNFGISVIR